MARERYRPEKESEPATKDAGKGGRGGRGEVERAGIGTERGPSASERPVISFYIHPAHDSSRCFSTFDSSYLSLMALTLFLGDCATEFPCRGRSETKSRPCK